MYAVPGSPSEWGPYLLLKDTEEMSCASPAWCKTIRHYDNSGLPFERNGLVLVAHGHTIMIYMYV